MAAIGKSWAGSVYGTNTGNIFLKFEEVEPKLRGTLRHLDQAYGLAVFTVEGSFEEKLHLVATPQQSPEGVELGTLSITAMLTSEGHLQGEWISTTGTAGTFAAFPHDQEMVQATKDLKSNAPEQIYLHTIVLGSLSLYEPDIVTLISEVKKDFKGGRLIATYSTGVGEATKYVEDFSADMARLRSLTYLKLQIQEPEAHGINKITIVELRAYGVNEVRVQGINEAWTIGRAQSLANVLRNYENIVVTGYKKFGLNLNSIIFLGMLILIPEVPSRLSRTIFVGAVVALLAILLWLHSKFIPNATIKLAGPVPSRVGRFLPTAFSWLFAIVASIVAAYIYTWLTRGAP